MPRLQSAAVTSDRPKTGYLLINVGTPDSASVADVRRYLKEFLSDPRMLDIHPVARWLLLHLVILPFRAKTSAAQYAHIWSDEGSPLLIHGQALRDAVAERLPGEGPVALGMRYGSPSMESALDELVAAGVDRVVALPLFPQYTSAAWGSAAERLYRLAGERWNVPSLVLVPPFFDDAGYIEAMASQARPILSSGPPADRVLFSYHGIPERHCERSAPGHCFQSDRCCEALVAANQRCYRAQCFATSRALAAALDLAEGSWEVAFQSRLGRTPWIRPYTDERVVELARGGARRVVVLEPSLVADCLETVEEIEVRAREAFLADAPEGASLELVPSLNASSLWVDVVVRLLSGAADQGVAASAAR